MSMAHRIQKIQRHPTFPSQQTAKPILHRQIRDTEAALAVEEKVEADKLRECFESFQLKYDIDRGSPWWKKLYFWLIYLPFARFSFIKIGIVPMDHIRCARCHAIPENGQLGWLERQSVWPEKWQALKDAERYPFGGVERLPFNMAERAETCAPLSQFPNSAAREQYEELDSQQTQMQSALHRLNQKLSESDSLVNWRRPKSA